MINVITIDREYGSGAADIAEKLAQRLGWKLWDQLLTNEIARLMECDCRVVEEREEKRNPRNRIGIGGRTSAYWWRAGSPCSFPGRGFSAGLSDSISRRAS